MGGGGENNLLCHHCLAGCRARWSGCATFRFMLGRIKDLSLPACLASCIKKRSLNFLFDFFLF